MNKKLLLLTWIAFFLPTLLWGQANTYTLVISGYDWGAAVNSVVIPLPKKVSTIDPTDYQIIATRQTECMDFPPAMAKGERTIVFACVSDEKGNRVASGNYARFDMAVGPDLMLGSPMQFLYSKTCVGTRWIDYALTITRKSDGQLWDTEGKRLIPPLSGWELDHRFSYGDNKALTYASFAPQTENEKPPLIIWLHGGGEGGTDTQIPLLANLATNYASPEIQHYFDGAYVLVPQTPGAWMHNAKGVSTRGKEDDVYHVALMDLIKDFVAGHPDIDTDRIYLGGCSNGGYMTLKLMIEHPDYFAAGFVSALAYSSQYLTDEHIQSISHLPIWFTHAADDEVTNPEQTVLPVYKRLLAAGARDVHLSYYDHVVDVRGFFGGDNYWYNGHLSWIYVHINACRKIMNGNPITLMEWLAGQTK